VAKIASLKSELKELSKVAKGLAGSSSTIMNKIDDNKRGISDLFKRMVKLDSHKH
jgi:hypothetical protein